MYDDHIITYLTFGNEKDIKEISLADNDKAIDELKVQPLSSLVHQFTKTCRSRSFVLRCEEREYQNSDVRLRLTIPSLRSLQVPPSAPPRHTQKERYEF